MASRYQKVKDAQVEVMSRLMTNLTLTKHEADEFGCNTLADEKRIIDALRREAKHLGDELVKRDCDIGLPYIHWVNRDQQLQRWPVYE